MATGNPYSMLPEGERYRRVGELIAAAASRYWQEERSAGRCGNTAVAPQPVLDVTDLVTEPGEKAILRYLTQKISASPAKIGSELGVAHTTLVRRLARLRAGGLISVAGKTRGARYELTAPQRN